MDEMWCYILMICIMTCYQAIKANQVEPIGEPCNFLDSINITSGHLDQHGNYLYDGMVYKKGSYGEYDYIVENMTVKMKAEPHVRGCICSFKPCIRVCCIGETSKKPNCVHKNVLTVPVRDDDDIEINLIGHTYGVLVGQSCGRTFKLEPEDYPEDRWYFVVSIDEVLPPK